MSEQNTGPGNDETTPELTELDGPPAPPLEAPPAPGDGEEDRDEASTPPSSSPSSPSIRERMAQLKARETSPGFGVAGKFSEARADYTDQHPTDHR